MGAVIDMRAAPAGRPFQSQEGHGPYVGFAITDTK